jgi:DeoR family transcriptional regulator of aga operon
METLLNLSGTERQEQIGQLIEREQRITVARICDLFAVSEATARRDLELLAEQGRVRRVHGGAILNRQAPPELPILDRSSDQVEEKRSIGRAAASLVQDGDAIFLGSGSTVLAMVEHLRERRRLTIITNSLPVANALADSTEITLVMLGGMFRASELSFIGHLTDLALSEVRVDKVFIGTRAMDIENGLTNAYLPETLTDRAILRIGREIMVLADHTKCARVSAAFLAPITSIHTLVTDGDTPHEFIRALQERGVRVIIS